MNQDLLSIMQPIHQLLARIRWDAAFAKGRFVIGYWDRVAGKVLRADLGEIAWDAENPSFFDLIDAEGTAHAIPFHRVREVWRDGRLIWARLPPAPGGKRLAHAAPARVPKKV